MGTGIFENPVSLGTFAEKDPSMRGGSPLSKLQAFLLKKLPEDAIAKGNDRPRPVVEDVAGNALTPPAADAQLRQAAARRWWQGDVGFPEGFPTTASIPAELGANANVRKYTCYLTCAGIDTLIQRLAATEAEKANLSVALATALVKQKEAEVEREAILQSTIWRATWPLRHVASNMPSQLRQILRRLVRASYGIRLSKFAKVLLGDSAAREKRLGLDDNVRSARDGSLSGLEYDCWVHDYDTLSDVDRAAIRESVDQLSIRPIISILMIAYETTPFLLQKTIASVRAQLYPGWELCVVTCAHSTMTTLDQIRVAANEDSRIKSLHFPGGTAAGLRNTVVGLATGEFVAFVSAGDVIPEHALYEVAIEFSRHKDTDLIYTDEDEADLCGRRFNPYFKPDWNIDLLFGHNFFGGLGLIRRLLLEQIGGYRDGVLEDNQDYDVLLRSTAATSPLRIRHIPVVLYHRCQSSGASDRSSAKTTFRAEDARRAISRHLSCQGVKGVEVVPVDGSSRWNRVRWPLPDSAPRASVIVPTRDQPALLARCVAGLLHRTDYPNLEIIVVDNDSHDTETIALSKRLVNDVRVRIVPYPGAFNYAALNNAAVSEASGEVIVLLNNDVDVINSDWLREMVTLALRPDVGAVGAKLRFADGRIQHAGVVLGIGESGVAHHFGYQAQARDPGYFGQFALTREVSAVTGACLCLRKEVFNAVGGLDAEHLAVLYNDVDLCLRIRRQGLRVIWTPFAELYHLESASRGLDRTPDQLARAEREVNYMRAQWGQIMDSDPFYNRNFDRSTSNFALAIPTRRERRYLLNLN